MMRYVFYTARLLHPLMSSRLNKRFGIMHGMSSMVNMVGLLATMWYAGTLSEL